jgi:hypothetical protein
VKPARRPYHRHCLPYVTCAEQPITPEFNRGELRLAAEVMMIKARGGFVPATVHQRAMRTIERLGE